MAPSLKQRRSAPGSHPLHPTFTVPDGWLMGGDSIQVTTLQIDAPGLFPSVESIPLPLDAITPETLKDLWAAAGGRNPGASRIAVTTLFNRLVFTHVVGRIRVRPGAFEVEPQDVNGDIVLARKERRE